MDLFLVLLASIILYIVWKVTPRKGDEHAQNDNKHAHKDKEIEDKTKALNVERSYQGALDLARKGDWENAYFVYEDDHNRFWKGNEEEASRTKMSESEFREDMERSFRIHRMETLREENARRKLDILINNGANSDNDIVRLYYDGEFGSANRLYQRIHNCDSVDASEGIHQLMMELSWDLILRDITDQHIDALKRNMREKIVSDDYGNSDDSKWITEIQYFVKNVLFKNSAISLRQEYINELTRTIREYVSYRSLENTVGFDDRMSPIDYEHYCSDVLASAGWDVKCTPATGDQGVDLVAIKQQLKVAIQCKLYSTPVGNKAVQEVAAGMQHIGADLGVVVSNSTYTKSAKELAGSTGVRLLHHSDLTSL